MKRVVIGLMAASISLSACGKDNSSQLAEEVKDLKSEKTQSQKEYETLKKQNDQKDKAIKAKEDELAAIKKKQEEAVKKEITQEEKAKKEQAAAEQKQAAEEQKMAEKHKVMPNTIDESTKGQSSVVLNKDDIGLSLVDSGMKVNIGQLQIFKVKNMPEGQSLVFNGATDGYVIIYQVTAENATEEPLYYNNNTRLKVGEEVRYSDFASFIPSDYQEMSMKPKGVKLNEYAPHSRTTSYKSIVLSTEDYSLLKQGKAELVIEGGISQNSDFSNKSTASSEGYHFK